MRLRSGFGHGRPGETLGGSDVVLLKQHRLTVEQHHAIAMTAFGAVQYLRPAEQPLGFPVGGIPIGAIDAARSPRGDRYLLAIADEHQLAFCHDHERTSCGLQFMGGKDPPPQSRDQEQDIAPADDGPGDGGRDPFALDHVD